MNRGRLFIDVTRSYDSPFHAGIQKVVRGLYRSLRRQAPEHGLEVVPVVLTARGAVDVGDLPLHPFEPAAAADDPALPTIDIVPGLPMRLRLWLTKRSETSHAGKAALLALRIASRTSRLPRELKGRLRPPPVASFEEGDILLMPDASWQVDPWPAVEQAKRAGARVVGIWYDTIPFSHPEHFHPELPPQYTAYFKKMMEKADLVIAISGTVRDEVRAWAERFGVTAPRVEAAWPGVDLAPAARDRRPEVARILAKPTVVIVATLEPRKGHGLLVDAAEQLWAGGGDFNLLIAGRFGWKVDALKEMVERHPERGRRLFHFDDLSDGEIVDILQAASVLALPSEAEGFGLPIVEAELAGCPVACSDIPVFREVASPATRFFAPREAAALASALKPFLSTPAQKAKRQPLRPAVDAGFARYGREVLALCLDHETAPAREARP